MLGHDLICALDPCMNQSSPGRGGKTRFRYPWLALEKRRVFRRFHHPVLENFGS